MGVFCDLLKLGSTAALNCQTGQSKGRYREKELLFLLVSLFVADRPVRNPDSKSSCDWSASHKLMEEISCLYVM